MTIKQRLYISNILMIIVPIAVSAAVLACGTLISLWIFFQGTNAFLSQVKLYDFQSNLSRQVDELLDQRSAEDRKNAEAKIVKLLDQNQAQLKIYKEKTLVSNLGKSSIQGTEKLIKTLDTIGGEGTASDETINAVCRYIKCRGGTYTIYLFSPHKPFEYKSYIDAAENIAIVLVILVVAAVFITSRYLSRFVLRKIESSLDILTDGVSQISEGNLDYRILYDGKDEFTPVCQDFNEMAQRMKDSIEQIQKHEQNRKELLAGISHDLRTPLTSINAYVDGILDGVAATPEKQKRYLKTIQKKAMEINGMVEQLFLFSKLDLGQYPVHLQHLDLRREAEEMIRSNQEEYGRYGLTLHLKEGGDPVPAVADSKELCNIFENILSNSLKYKTKEQGNLFVSVETRGSRAVLTMEDDGPGIAKEDLPKIFDTFYRCDPARHSTKNGSGLGLAICAKMVEGMGGTITAESEDGKGLKIIVTLLKGEGINEKNTDC